VDACLPLFSGRITGLSKSVCLQEEGPEVRWEEYGDFLSLLICLNFYFGHTYHTIFNEKNSGVPSPTSKDYHLVFLGRTLASILKAE
jgi:hypothetical protein